MYTNRAGCRFYHSPYAEGKMVYVSHGISPNLERIQLCVHYITQKEDEYLLGINC